MKKTLLFLMAITFSLSFTMCGGGGGLSGTKYFADGGAAYDWFGWSIAISADGSTIAVGAFSGPGSNDVDQGCIYVYTGGAGSWSLSATLTASDGASSERFGELVSIDSDGSTIVTGAESATGDNSDNDGAAYVFVRPALGWSDGTQDARLTGSDCVSGASFGRGAAVSSDGSTIVIGAGKYMGSTGTVYVFDRPGGGWADANEDASLETDDLSGLTSQLGCKVAVSADGSTVFAGTDAEAVYVFNRPGGGWADATTEDAKLTAGTYNGLNQFGWTLALSSDGSTLAVGAYQPNKSPDGGGQVHVFVKPDTGWADAAEDAVLQAKIRTDHDYLGESIALSSDGSMIIAGATQYDTDDIINPGSAYVFKRPSKGWSSSEVINEKYKLESSEQGTGFLFGCSVASAGDGSFFVVGEKYSDITEDTVTDDSQGAFYVFE